MITWKLLVYCCTLLLLLNQVAEVGSQENTNAIFAIPAFQIAQNLSLEFSNIMTNNLGVDALAVRVKQCYLDYTCSTAGYSCRATESSMHKGRERLASVLCSGYILALTAFFIIERPT